MFNKNIDEYYVAQTNKEKALGSLFRAIEFFIYFLVGCLLAMTISKALTNTAEGAMIDVCKAAVRVSVNEGGGAYAVGSGGIVGADADSYLVVTCEHVANKPTATVEIVRFGQAVKSVKGTVVGRDANSDCAFIRIKKTDLEGYVPGLLPIDAGFELKKGDLLWGASFPQGGALTIFEMSYIGMTADGWIEAKPAIKQGRSGGIVVDADCTRVIGITWGTREDRCYIVPAKRFAKAVGRELTAVGEFAALDFSIAEKSLFNYRLNKENIKNPVKILPLRERDKGGRQRWNLRKIKDFILEEEVAPKEEEQPKVDQKIQPSKAASVIFRGQSYEMTQCPGGTCPVPSYPSIQTTRPKSSDVKPANPLPIAQPKKETTLPEPDADIPETPVRTKQSDVVPKQPLNVLTINDPRLDKIVGIESTIFGIQKKADEILDKADKIIEDRENDLVFDVTKFRDETLAEFDKRIEDIRSDVDQKLDRIATQVATLEATNQQIAELRTTIENFSILPNFSVLTWLWENATFLFMLAIIAGLIGYIGFQYYKNKKRKNV